MKRLLGRLFGDSAPEWDLPQPDEPQQVIGDVHGRVDLLERLLDKLDPSLPVTLVGDLVDRGDMSRQVLETAQALPDRWQAQATCLIGNHEDMLLRFLEKPERGAAPWLRFGGLQTLASFGVAFSGSDGDAQAAEAARDAFAEALGDDTIEWLKDLPAHRQSGNLHIVHAGADPAEPMPLQARRTMIWGHPEFETTDRDDGQWVCHGHTIVDAAFARAGRIATDTGAYATGRLTAAVITPGEEVRFVHT